MNDRANAGTIWSDSARKRHVERQRGGRGGPGERGFEVQLCPEDAPALACWRNQRELDHEGLRVMDPQP